MISKILVNNYAMMGGSPSRVLEQLNARTCKNNREGMFVTIWRGMEGMRYADYEFTLERGSTLLLYTDGVAEAANAQNQLFGTDRMLEALNREKVTDMKLGHQAFATG